MKTLKETTEQIQKHFPFANSKNDKLVILLAAHFSEANTSEKEIEEICDLISDMSDESFQRGLDSINL